MLAIVIGRDRGRTDARAREAPTEGGRRRIAGPGRAPDPRWRIAATAADDPAPMPPSKRAPRREPGDDVDVRGVDLDGGQGVEGDRRFTRPRLALENDWVAGRHVGCRLECGGGQAGADAATRAIVTSCSRTASARPRWRVRPGAQVVTKQGPRPGRFRPATGGRPLRTGCARALGRCAGAAGALAARSATWSARGGHGARRARAMGFAHGVLLVGPARPWSERCRCTSVLRQARCAFPPGFKGLDRDSWQALQVHPNRDVQSFSRIRGSSDPSSSRYGL